MSRNASRAGRLLTVLSVCAAVMAMSLLVGCNRQAKVSDGDVNPINHGQLQAMLAQDGRQRAALIDVRSIEKYEAGHIPGALHIPLPELQAGDARLGNARYLIVYGESWRDRLSLAGAKKLLALGYRNVLDYRGGYEDWQNEQRK